MVDFERERGEPIVIGDGANILSQWKRPSQRPQSPALGRNRSVSVCRTRLWSSITALGSLCASAISVARAMPLITSALVMTKSSITCAVLPPGNAMVRVRIQVLDQESRSCGAEDYPHRRTAAARTAR
jgi:hypothetical protein